MSTFQIFFFSKRNSFYFFFFLEKSNDEVKGKGDRIIHLLRELWLKIGLTFWPHRLLNLQPLQTISSLEAFSHGLPVETQKGVLYKCLGLLWGIKGMIHVDQVWHVSGTGYMNQWVLSLCWIEQSFYYSLNIYESPH